MIRSRKSRLFPKHRQLCMALAGAAAIVTMQGAAAQDDPGAFSGFQPGNTIRGTVTAAGSDNFTIRTEAGDIYKVIYSANSRILLNRGPAKPSDIHAGDMIIATGNVDNKAKTVGAAVLIGIDAEEVRKAREGLGKTWTGGKITAIDVGDTPKITVTRLDGITQTFEVDENTSFKHRHDSITLADLKTGDSVRAEGHLNGKVFLATTVHLFVPGERPGGGPGPGPNGEGGDWPGAHGPRPAGESPQSGTPPS